uniref:Calponin-homology (CH) domain-containing protein n=1 Tax=Heterorhabditis bacteriophora TaxID=37862 RepID=A0A1I7XRT1_HETBA
MIHCRTISIRDDCGVYCDIIFGVEIKVENGESFAAIISRFILTRFFSDPKIMKNKKFARGTVKSETFYYLSISCLEEVFSELSREVLSASGLPMKKAFAKIGFKPIHKQGFFDEYDYRVKDFADLTDGVILSKLVELICGFSAGTVISRLRNPGGDRLRKIGNVNIVLAAAKEGNIDTGEVRSEAIVGGIRESILELLWRLVGIYVGASDERNLRRESLNLANRIASGFGIVSTSSKGEDLVLHICKQIGEQLGIEVDSFADLRDGFLLASAWKMYNETAPDIAVYPGESLFYKVVNASVVRGWLARKQYEKLREKIGARESNCTGTFEDMAAVKIQKCEKKLSEDFNEIVEKESGLKENAVVRIQAWWRGNRQRFIMHNELVSRHMSMKMYKLRVEAEEGTHIDGYLTPVPVHTKLRESVTLLFHTRMYDVKVAAFIINRLTALSPHVCSYFVVDIRGLAVILDRLEQVDRGPGMTEVVAILAEVFLRIAQCPEPAVIREVDFFLKDCVKVAFHLFYAFYTYPNIVQMFGEAIVSFWKKPGAVKYFNKSKYYISAADQRFNRLPDSDIRKATLEMMKIILK